jgi:hypothetical protein
MIGCVAIGTFTGFVFLTVLLFVAGNIDDVISSSAGPLLQILFNATKNKAGAICLLMYVIEDLGVVCANFSCLNLSFPLSAFSLQPLVL